jgi:DNA helicase HerA-like ATPase
MSSEKEDHIGIILSGSNTTEATCQLLEASEKGGIAEGTMLLIRTNNKPILCRVAEIIPYNAFYTAGDPWSEARRKNVKIPDEIARQYEVCKLELLTEMPRGEIKNPPIPGNKVIRIDVRKHEKDIFGVSSSEPKHVWFGTLAGYDGAPIPLYVENMPMHMAIFGVTGSGKSFDTGALLEKLVSIPVNGKSSVSYPMVIIDAHGDYTDYVEHVANGGKLGEIGWIKRYVFPKAYLYRTELRKKGSLVQPIGINLDSLSQRELAEIIVLFYKGTIEGSELQVDSIDQLFDRMRALGFTKLQDVFLQNYPNLKQELERLATAMNMHSSTKGAISRALDAFRVIETNHNLLSTRSDLQTVTPDPDTGAIKEVEFVERITKEGGVAVFDFSADGAPGVDLKTKQFVMTYLASLLFEQFTNYKIRKQDRYLMFVIEETQNFAPDKTYPISSTLANRKLASIATQGRKFGLSLCLISQRPSFVDRIVLSMCNTFLIHRISPEDIGFVKGVTGGLPASLTNRLTTLETGYMVVTGQMNTVPFPLLIHVPKSDRQVKQTVGQTKVMESLARLRGVSVE